MKCNACYERLEPTQISRGRCPYCGAAIMAKKEKLPIGFWLCAVPFLLIGLLFFIVGLDSLLSYENGKAYHVQLDAQIVKILVEETEDSDGDTEIDYTVFVSYEYDGTLYEKVELGHHNSGMKVGDWIEVKIDSRNPGEIVENLWWIMIVALVPLAIGAAILYFTMKKRRNQSLKAHGCC